MNVSKNNLPSRKNWPTDLKSALKMLKEASYRTNLTQKKLNFVDQCCMCCPIIIHFFLPLGRTAIRTIPFLVQLISVFSL
jgi:hypothetical protein